MGPKPTLGMSRCQDIRLVRIHRVREQTADGGREMKEDLAWVGDQDADGKPPQMRLRLPYATRWCVKACDSVPGGSAAIFYDGFPACSLYRMQRRIYAACVMR
jgi:hypothetical protein